MLCLYYKDNEPILVEGLIQQAPATPAIVIAKTVDGGAEVSEDDDNKSIEQNRITDEKAQDMNGQ